ncbi:hypothetical protein [Bauldia litoralis]|uniref:Uncharacterized protein n=1 Tax=Bauldia litoralis TaxID=665467 RepID=A0A1G6EB35_9HYPH|nr:hypothetical protein [Bauldia litoralis]SDB54613.1 hypothetical protein SAMN02982931_04311 [Bauldia litoralis]
MSIVAIQCPKTGQQISTGIETDAASFKAAPFANHTVECWACGGRHSWSRRWATLVEVDDPAVKRAGVPIPGSSVHA